MQASDLKRGEATLVRVKSGKLYKTYWTGEGEPYIRDGKVCATQWQINEKFPGGRYYGPLRMLKLTEIELA